MVESVLLRDVEPDDLEFFFAYEHDPENVRRSRFTPREREKFMTHWERRVLGDPANFVQTVTVDGEPAGHFGSWWADGKRYVGYVLGRAYWGRGVGTEALRLFLAREPVRPLYADPFVGNTASVRLLEKLGFEHARTVFDGDVEYVELVLHAR